MEQKTFTTSFLGTEYTCHYIKEPTEALKALEFLMKKDCLFAIDTETAAYPQYKHVPKAGLSPHLSDIRLLQVFDGRNVLVFDLSWFPERKRKMFLPFLSSKRFVAHYAVFDLQRFIQMGVVDMNIHCTHIIAKLLFHAIYPDDIRSASLEGLCKSLFNTDIAKQPQASDWSEPELTFEQIEYAALDPIRCMMIADKLVPGLGKYGLNQIYQLEKDTQHPIAQMQLNGFTLDVEGHRELIPAWTEELVSAKRRVQELTGLKSLTGPKLAGWLEENLPPEILAMWPLTEGGSISTSADTFIQFDHYDFVEPFSIYQKKAILCSTFGQKLINQVNPATHRLHPHFKQTGARTGRLSCADPNLQNLPSDKIIRANFIPREGHVFLCADYSQIELRIVAEVSQDPKMLKAYREGLDLHKMTAAGVLGITYSQVTTQQRKMGKCIRLGLLYGLGAEKYCHHSKKNLGIPLQLAQAQELINKDRANFAGLRAWQVSQANNCRISMMAQTPFGKKRKLNDKTYYGGGLNMPIQGGAAEVNKRALVRLEKAFRGTGFLTNSIHDESLIEVPISNAIPEQLKEMHRCMTLAYKDVFPEGITRGLIEANFGTTWTEAKQAPIDDGEFDDYRLEQLIAA